MSYLYTIANVILEPIFIGGCVVLIAAVIHCVIVNFIDCIRRKLVLCGFGVAVICWIIGKITLSIIV